MTYPAVYDLVVRLRARTGIDFDPHWYRHAMATRALRDGVPIEVVSQLLGHASIATTSAIYGPSEEVDPDGADILDQMLTTPHHTAPSPMRPTLSRVGATIILDATAAGRRSASS